MSVHSRELNVAFPFYKQADISTALAAAGIDQALPFREFAPTSRDHPATVSDRNWYGKGHGFATFFDVVQKRVVIPSRGYSMTQLSALVFPAFCLGSIATTQPNSATAATVYDHKLTFADPATAAECCYLSLIEEMGSEYQNLISGAVVNSFQLAANRNDHAVISWEGFARTQASDTTSMPSLAASQSYFKLLASTITFGSGAGSDISDQVLNFNLNVTQNAKAWFLPGQASGQQDLIKKILVGDQAISGSLAVFITNTQRALFLNQTECVLKIVLVGDQIGATGFYHTVTIEIPNLKIATEAFSEEEQQGVYTMNFTEESVLKAGGEDFFSWTVRTNIDDTKILAEAS